MRKYKCGWLMKEGKYPTKGDAVISADKSKNEIKHFCIKIEDRENWNIYIYRSTGNLQWIGGYRKTCGGSGMGKVINFSFRIIEVYRVVQNVFATILLLNLTVKFSSRCDFTSSVTAFHNKSFPSVIIMNVGSIKWTDNRRLNGRTLERGRKED